VHHNQQHTPCQVMKLWFMGVIQ